jgi:peptidyl-prolyl cis-trans isomerase C
MGRMRDKSVNEFIARSILLTEADKAKIEVTEEEKKEVLAELSKRLPKDKTIEQIMKESPLGEAKMMEQLTMGIRINKLLKDTFTNVMSVSEQEINDYMEQNKDNLVMPETVAAKHILVKTEETDDAKTREAKKAKAEEIRKKLTDGADFAKTAAEFSDCPSKEDGGNLGTFTKEKMVPEFSNAAFSQPTNTIGQVVETQMGYHIIFVTAHNAAGTAPREDVANFLKERNREKDFVAYMEKLRATAEIKDYRQQQ